MANWYSNILGYPRSILALMIIVTLVAVYHLRYFNFDASADTLVVQGDPRLEQYNEMSALFGGDEFIVLTYAADDVLTPAALDEIDSLQRQIDQLPGIKRSYSILDAPLTDSPPIPLEQLADEYRTLRDDDVDLELAARELTTSPLFADYLIAVDAKSTAISADLIRDKRLADLRSKRDALRANPDRDAEALDDIETAYDKQRARYVANRDTLIESLRDIRNGYKGEAKLFISGVPMIAADMLSYVKSDLMIFGSLVSVLIVVMLTFFFRKPRWVLIPVTICLVTVISTMGILGALRTPVTVVSSNFISLLSIISISFSIHLVVRYRELLAASSSTHHRELVLETMISKFAPCLYTALTTLLAFGSLLGSRILPIEDFGWMMCLGIVIGLPITYLLFPALLLTIGAAGPSKTLGQTIRLTELFQKLAMEHTRKVLIVTGISVVPAVIGLTQITFDNRFSDYFGDATEIRQGLVHIDEHLGGTLPLDTYIRFEQFEAEPVDDGFFSDEGDPYPERYWFTPEKISVLRDLEQQLAGRPETGKVFSLASLEEASRRFNEGRPLGGVEIAYVLGELPEDIRAFLIEPWSNPREGWMRINARVMESSVQFSKEALIADVETHAIESLGLSPDDVVVTGMIVLFNDMLRQLAESQLRTLSYVIIATFVMFSLLLRSLQLALIALIPNIISAMLVIAFMGYAGIPMDMMTITIAAISIGIGVDDAIHYLHRFRAEFEAGLSIREAAITAHRTIGRAMYFTTMTIMGGFSILAFSNFVPTVNFGLLTTLAMAIALIANTTVLPSSLITFYRPGSRII